MPRGKPVRIVYSAIALLVIIVLTCLVYLLANHAWIGELENAVREDGLPIALVDLVRLVVFRTVIVIAIGALSRSTSYRARDMIIGFVPVVGEILVVRLCWRASLLPFVDWNPRIDEMGMLAKADLGGDDKALWRRKCRPGIDRIQ